MVTPAIRRRVVGILVESPLKISERRACKVLGVQRSSVKYESVAQDQSKLVEAMRTMAAGRPRAGYRGIHRLLRRRGHHVNHKRVLRAGGSCKILEGRARGAQSTWRHASPSRKSRRMKKRNPTTKLSDELRAWLSKYLGKNARVTIDREAKDAVFIDWERLSAADGRSTEAFIEYFTDAASEVHVRAGKWTPVAVIGMGKADIHESFEELSNEGFLCVDEGGALLYFVQDDAPPLRELAPHYARLVVELEVEPPKPKDLVELESPEFATRWKRYLDNIRQWKVKAALADLAPLRERLPRNLQVLKAYEKIYRVDKDGVRHRAIVEDILAVAHDDAEVLARKANILANDGALEALGAVADHLELCTADRDVDARAIALAVRAVWLLKSGRGEDAKVPIGAFEALPRTSACPVDLYAAIEAAKSAP
jgi:hypothetical protein